MAPAGSLDNGVRVLCLSRCLICTQKDDQTPAVSFQKQVDFLVETKRDEHILAGYNVAYCLCLNFTDTSITQTRGSFDDCLLNDSLAVQQHLLLLKYKVHGGASQSFLDDMAPFCNLIGRSEILPRGPKFEYAFHQTLFPRVIKRLGTRLVALVIFLYEYPPA